MICFLIKGRVREKSCLLLEAPSIAAALKRLGSIPRIAVVKIKIWKAMLVQIPLRVETKKVVQRVPTTWSEEVSPCLSQSSFRPNIQLMMPFG